MLFLGLTDGDIKPVSMYGGHVMGVGAKQPLAGVCAKEDVSDEDEEGTPPPPYMSNTGLVGLGTVDELAVGEIGASV